MRSGTRDRGGFSDGSPLGERMTLGQTKCRFWSNTAVKAAKDPSEHYRHGHDARPEHDHVLGVAHSNLPYPADQQIAESQVEEAPQHVHGG